MIKKIIILAVILCSFVFVSCSHSPDTVSQNNIEYSNNRVPSSFLKKLRRKVSGFVDKLNNRFSRPVVLLDEIGTGHVNMIISRAKLRNISAYEVFRYVWNSKKGIWVADGMKRVNYVAAETPHTEKDLVSGSKYKYRVRARGDKSKSRFLVMNTKRTPQVVTNIDTELWIQYNAEELEHESVMMVEVNGKAVRCKLNSDHQYNVLPLPNRDYNNIINNSKLFLTPNAHPKPQNPECQFTLVRGRRYNVGVLEDDGSTEQVMRTLVYLGYDRNNPSGSNKGEVCALGDAGAAKQGLTSIPHYYMLRYWSRTNESEDTDIPVCNKSIYKDWGLTTDQNGHPVEAGL